MYSGLKKHHFIALKIGYRIVGLRRKYWTKETRRRTMVALFAVILSGYFALVKNDLENYTTNFLKSIHKLAYPEKYTGVIFVPKLRAIGFYTYTLFSVLFLLRHFALEEADRKKKEQLERDKERERNRHEMQAKILEEKRQTDLLKQIKSAVLKAPTDVFHNYSKWFDEANAILSEISDDASFENIQKAINNYLQLIYNLAWQFVVVDESEDFKLCINAMIFVPADAKNKPLVNGCLKHNGVYDTNKFDLADFKGFYLFDKTVSVSTDGDVPPKTIIPILEQEDREVPFGVYHAHVKDVSYEGRLNDHLKKKSDFNAYDQRVMEFFENDYGYSINSIFSFRFGPKESPIGIVNIHSDKQNHLGYEKLYFPVFSSLFIPMARSLEKSLDLYRLTYLS